MNKETDHTPRRRWYQFRLRTLLIFMTLFSIPFAFFGSEFRAALRDRAVASWVVSMGGHVDFEDRWLEQWIGGRVIGVHLDRTPVSDLTPLAGLKNLRTLRLFGTPVSDLTPLAGMKDLQMLYLASTQVSDLTPLAGLKNLQMLYLANTPVSDLSPLAGLKNLTELRLDNTQVSDLSPLAGLKDLRRLNLAVTEVDDLSPLAGLKDLRRLHLNRTPARNEQVEMLQRALPNCEISRSYRRRGVAWTVCDGP